MTRGSTLRPERNSRLTARRSPPVMPEGDLWVFAYGSLMWRPGFSFVQRFSGTLYGYRRALCVWSWVHRGTQDLPGLVLGLDLGGSCPGCVYRVAAGDAEVVLEYLYEREMVTNVYRPRMVQIHAHQQKLNALAFIVERRHAQYAGRLDPEEAARVVRHAVGKSGPNLEYLRSTLEHLRDMDVREPYLRRVWECLDSYEPAQADTAPTPAVES